MLPMETGITKLFNLGNLRWFSFMPDPLISTFNYQPWDHSTTLPLFHPNADLLHSTGHKHFIQRLIYQVAPNFIYYIYNYIVVNPLRFNNVQSRDVQRKLNQDIFIGDGFPGIRDLKQEAMNVDMVIPPTRGASRFSE
jgi:hypothetical protein